MAEKILYFDCFSGISGDMTMAALVDLGVPREYLISELAKLSLEGYLIHFATDERKGIHGLRADVILEKHSYGDHSRSGHNHLEHHNRTLSDIVEIIRESSLSTNVKEIALSIFQLLADAEGKIHGKPAEEVHFHEVGAIDSIVDIVAAAVCLDYLKPDRILCSTIELGGGLVKCSHGTIPVPAPATLEILKGIPVKSGAVPFEMTTPTGAAILAACVDRFTDNRNFTLVKIAYGVGHRDTAIPNVLRVILAEESAGPPGSFPVMDEAVVLECNIDDMNPELYTPLMDRFLEAGASDVYYTPIIMKKGRPAVKISVLAPADRETAMGKIIFMETSSFGYRRTVVGKAAMERVLEEKETSLGKVTVKTALLDGRRLKSKIEFEDCLEISRKKGISLPEVYRLIYGELYES